VLSADFGGKEKRMEASYADKLKTETMPNKTWRAVMMCIHADRGPRYLEPKDAVRFEATCVAMNDWADGKKRR
jgi:hypothetical protein